MERGRDLGTGSESCQVGAWLFVTARNLQETPANLLTPQLFCDRASELFAASDSVEVLVRDR